MVGDSSIGAWNGQEPGIGQYPGRVQEPLGQGLGRVQEPGRGQGSGSRWGQLDMGLRWDRSMGCGRNLG